MFGGQVGQRGSSKGINGREGVRQLDCVGDSEGVSARPDLTGGGQLC